MQVYVVISDTIAYGQRYHGIHGVHRTKESAHKYALSAITGIAQRHCYNVSTDDIRIEDNDYFYENNKVDIVVSCIEQRIL